MAALKGEPQTQRDRGTDLNNVARQDLTPRMTSLQTTKHDVKRQELSRSPGTPWLFRNYLCDLGGR